MWILISENATGISIPGMKTASDLKDRLRILQEISWRCKFQGAGAIINKTKLTEKKAGAALNHFCLKKGNLATVYFKDSVEIPTRIMFAFGMKKTRSASEMMNAFLLKAVPNVLEFNQNYLFLVSFAVVSFTLVH